jgi:uncharacterized protein (TIGR03435 family)
MNGRMMRGRNLVAGFLLLMVGTVASSVGQESAKAMAADAEPSFEVATIKPDVNEYQGIMGLGFRGRTFSARNVSLVDMIAFAYAVHPKQVLVGAQKWAATDRYDISGVPDKEGVPNVNQQRMMVQKLIADRFKLELKSDKQEMSAFVISVGKDGPKLVPTKLEGLNPVSTMRPSDDGWILSTQNASMKILAGFLQLAILDRPVVDKTGLTGRYDIALDFTPDSSQFNGHPPPSRPTDNPAPGLFDAIQQQLGLKISSEKAQVDVWTVEKAEKPSAN